MKKNKKILKLYEEWATEGSLPRWGLCGSTENEGISRLLDLVRPTPQDSTQLKVEGCSTVFWGYEIPFNSLEHSLMDKWCCVTPLRETLLLFMAALNNEL